MLVTPFSRLTLARLVPQEQLELLHAELTTMHAAGLTSTLLANFIRILLSQRETLCDQNPRTELVVTGPEPQGALLRDTAVVVRQMFLNAQHSVIITGFAVYQGRELFEQLAHRMQHMPALHVRMYLNIERPRNSALTQFELLRRFEDRFRRSHWPEDTRLPELYYDPRPLEAADGDLSACLHAKFVVTDARHVFITSANFTEAAQQRNIEVGLVSENQKLATELTAHFQSLVDHDYLRKLRWH